MFSTAKGRMIPVLLFGAALALGVFSAGCGEMMEDREVPWEPEEVEENAE